MIKEKILRFCANSLVPPQYKHIARLCKLLGWEEKRAVAFIQELVSAGHLIECAYRGESCYRLPYEDYPLYFEPESPEEADLFEKVLNSCRSHFRDASEVRYALMQPKTRLELTLLNYSLSQTSSVVAFVSYIVTTHPFLSALRGLGSEMATLLLNQRAVLQEKGKQVGKLASDFKELCENSYLSHELSLYNLPVRHLYSSVLYGQLDSTRLEEPSFESDYYFYAKAIGFQYQNNIPKALANYNKGLAAAKELSYNCDYYHISKHIPQSPFYCLSYLHALNEDTKPSARKKLRDLFARDAYGVDENLPFSSWLYLVHLLEEKVKPDKVLRAVASLKGIDFLLSVIVVGHYQLAQLTPELQERATAMIEQNQWHLLALEASYALPAFASRREELGQKLGLNPLLKPYIKLEAWQKELTKLDKLIQSQSPSSSKSAGLLPAESQGRIVYLIEDEHHIAPVLQKSKDGQKWTKGRAVALSSMVDGSTECMSEVDTAFAQTIKYVDDWYGPKYQINTAKAFVALIHHPYVYLKENRDVSVQIEGEEPYIEVSGKGQFFCINSNVQTQDDARIIIVRESQVLYKVFQLSVLQRDVLKIFERQRMFPQAAKEQLAQMLQSLSGIITVHSELLCDSVDMRQMTGSSRITVQILPLAGGVKVQLYSKPLETHPPYFEAGRGIEHCLAQDDEGQVNITRQLKKERSNYRKVREILRQVGQDDSVDDILMFEDMYECLELLDALQGLDKVLRIEWPKGSRLSIRGKASFDKLKLSAFTRGQWLEVEGEITVDQNLQLNLSELLERSRGKKGRFIELGAGEYLALSKKMRKKLAELDTAMSPNKKGALQISPYRSELLSSMESEGCSLKADKRYKELKERIHAAYEMDIHIPSALTAQLRDYQVDGYEWLSRLAAWGAGACLADDMGLGKSIQSIAIMLQCAQEGASLIIAPASVVSNWRREIQRFAPSLQCYLLHDKLGQREQMIEQAGPYDVIISTYGLLSREDKNITQKEWNVIVLDEAHNIKNRDTKASKIAMNLQGRFRLALTGTPIQNHLGEIWNLFQFTNPGLLGSFEQFREKFILPIEKDKDRSRQQELKRCLQPFLLRRTKSEVLDELPSKTEMIHYVELSEEERVIYENIRQNALQNLENGELNPIQTLAEITKLRQAACHPQLIDKDLPIHTSAKLKRLLEIISELLENKHSTLIFSQFTSFLSKVAQAFDHLNIPYFYLDGQTSIKERERLVQEFQQGKSPIFLISLKAGGTGLNLTAADYVIHMDPWWNPAIEDQASDRSHRIGQTRPVTIYKLIASQSIEERIIELHKSKKSLSDALLEGGDISAKLSREEMLELLSIK